MAQDDTREQYRRDWKILQVEIQTEHNTWAWVHMTSPYEKEKWKKETAQAL